MRFARLPMEERPTPPAPRTDDRVAALAGSAVWAVSLVVVLVQRDALLADDRGWWVWCCVAGLALGLVGLLHLQRREIKHRTAVRRARREARAAAREVPAGPARPSTTAAPASSPAPAVSDGEAAPAPEPSS
ncbi:DUF2530 domain-containing protein [uncultured Pseudokineococcus sp.]|uniref:DUF2530 domain-containing protein n=1 Tax=uncultured Pseudokineococcus sp. TaxID=1642928 RepID=UPI002614C41D|nr:DUF2530 domain-containing protein [uncultured Pseudokineococcus sp.]